MTFCLQVSLDPSLFRAYDIRGLVPHSLTPDTVYTLGVAIGSEAIARAEKTLVTARDGRLSGLALQHALNCGLRASGCDVIDIGAVPTPVLYFTAYHLTNYSGVMLTASHNPADYNGLKIVLTGETLAERRIQQLYQRITQQAFVYGCGTVKTMDTLPAYITHVVQRVQLSRALRVVVDCGNGIAARVAPQLLCALGCEVIELYCEVDGCFPNHHPDPAVAENLQDLRQAVVQVQADLGIAFDGDGDRLGIVTNRGEIIWPDRQMMLFSIDILARAPGAKIIYDVKSSRCLHTVIEQYHGQPIMWKTGHALIKAKLQETGALLAGEVSGHIFFKERWYGFDDALYAAARLLEILARDSRDVHAIFAGLPNIMSTPELKLPIPEEQKSYFMQTFIKHAQFEGASVTMIDGLRADFYDGWGLVRASNTTPCLVLRFEAETALGLLRIQNVFRKQLLAIDSTLLLPF